MTNNKWHMTHDTWQMTHEAKCQITHYIYDKWQTIHDIWCIMHYIWYLSHDAWCIWCIWCMWCVWWYDDAYQGYINRGTCSQPELTSCHVLTSAYVIIFWAVARNAVNKSVWRKKTVLDFPSTNMQWISLFKHQQMWACFSPSEAF